MLGDIPTSLSPLQGYSVAEIAGLQPVSDVVPLLADLYRVLAELWAEGSLDEQDSLESRHVDVVEEPPEPPSHALSRLMESSMDLVAVVPSQDHVAWAVKPQLHPEVLRIHQPTQRLEELLVFLR